jgi:hypothetical protein
MINILEDGLRPSEAASFSATAHSAGRVSPNGYLCVTTSTGSIHGAFSSREEITLQGAGAEPTTPVSERMTSHPPRV